MSLWLSSPCFPSAALSPERTVCLHGHLLPKTTATPMETPGAHSEAQTCFLWAPRPFMTDPESFAADACPGLHEEPARLPASPEAEDSIPCLGWLWALELGWQLLWSVLLCCPTDAGRL